ncbi:MAG: hypothetical protein RLN84_16550 [Rhodospirillaceae bacterium]
MPDLAMLFNYCLSMTLGLQVLLSIISITAVVFDMARLTLRPNMPSLRFNSETDSSVLSYHLDTALQ